VGLTEDMSTDVGFNWTAMLGLMKSKMTLTAQAREGRRESGFSAA
jgi:hypothetical protein